MLGTDKKKRTKEKLIIMSCTWKIRLSPNENQECQVQKCKKKNDEKMHKHFDNFYISDGIMKNGHFSSQT